MIPTTTHSEEASRADAVLSALAHAHRRAALRALDEAEGQRLEFDALATSVSARVRNGDALDGRHHERVRAALHHQHLPKLAESGLIDYDTDAMCATARTTEFDWEPLALAATHDAVE